MKFRLIVILLLLKGIASEAQISEGGMPYSFNRTHLKALISIPEYRLKPIDESRLKEEDRENPTPFRYSIFEEVSIDIKNGITETINEPRGKIWRYAVSSEKAYSIQIVFKNFSIPPGARLFIYNSDYSEVYGAFTSLNETRDSGFTIADFPGKNLIIEYFEPENPAFNGRVIIGHIGQAYQNILQQEEKLQENEYIDINCIEGRNWQNEKHAVCKITFRVGRTGYLCSGALINNTSNDGTPYFLTANHCISDTSVAKTVIAHFNFERQWCNGPQNTSRTLSGSSMMTTGQKSDYTLLKLNNTPPPSYQPFYAGWDIGNYLDNQNTSIHHPEGIEKKISIDNDKIVTYDFPISWDEGETTPSSSHWLVVFDVGKTSEGSSGGPLFSKQKRIIGQLHGGGEGDEYYGKLNYSWNNSLAGYEPLKTFLDPGNTGVSFINGYYPPSNPPDAYFSTLFADVCVDTPVSLSENSSFAPTSRTWTITPSSFSFVNGTNRNSVNPEVRFTAPGNYNIKLNVSNNNGQDSVQVNNALKAGNTINVSMLTNLGDSLCFHNFDSLVLTGLGAENYSWTVVQNPSPFFFSKIIGDTVVLKKQGNTMIDSTYTLHLNVRGTMGTCIDTAKQTLKFISVTNDNIANAIEIGLGTSKVFSNLCATIEANEPVPPADSCTGLKSWCDEYGTGKNIVENSVWFKFTGPPTGKVSLKSSGFDNEIAIYDAASSQDILAGNYTLLAANDDESDVNPNPRIPEVNVQPGKTYWIQVDGSGGGTEGSFALTLSDKSITSFHKDKMEPSIKIYPQPVQNMLILEHLNFSKYDTKIEILSLTGKLILGSSNTKKGDKISVNVENLSPGVYLLKISQNNEWFIKKFIKN